MKNEFKIEDLMPLRKIEERFKEKYLQKPYEFDIAMGIADFERDYSEVLGSHVQYSDFSLANVKFSEALSEESYFQTQVDVSAVMHLRYMPPVFHISEFFEIDCVLSGDITSFIGQQKLFMTSGDLIIIAPNTDHASFTASDDAIMINLLVRKSTFEEHFMGILPENDLFKNFFEKSLYKKTDTPYLFFATKDVQFLTDNVLTILSEYQRNSRYKSTMLSSLLSVFFVELLRNHEKDLEMPSQSNSSLSENIVFILEYLQKNYSRITLSHLASFFNYSNRQMQRILESATGMGFNENIKKLRMSKAAEFLKSTNMTTTDIADELGFYDSSSFRQAFKKYYGCTPTEYRYKQF